MIIAIYRILWGLIAIAALSLSIWLVFGIYLFLYLSGCIIFISFVAFVFMEHVRSRKFIEELPTSEERLLVHEIELYLLRLLGARQGIFICPVCDMPSYNPHDLKEGYCGKCHDFTGPKYPEEFDV